MWAGTIGGLRKKLQWKHWHLYLAQIWPFPLMHCDYFNASWLLGTELCPLPKFLCWSPNPPMWWSLEVGRLAGSWAEMRSCIRQYTRQLSGPLFHTGLILHLIPYILEMLEKKMAYASQMALRRALEKHSLFILLKNSTNNYRVPITCKEHFWTVTKAVTLHFSFPPAHCSTDLLSKSMWICIFWIFHVAEIIS